MKSQPVANKQLVFDVSSKTLEGVKDVRKAVQVTMGPKGRHVGIFSTITTYDDGGNPSVLREPQVTKDGVTVAREIAFADKCKDFAAQTLIKAASNTCDQAGDGTTTSIVLGAAIVENGIKAINSGANPVLVNRGIEKAVKAIVEEIARMSKSIDKDVSKLDFVAKVSANNDEEIGNIVSEAIKKVGKDGIVTAYSEVGAKTGLEITEGFAIDSGAVDAFLKDKSKMQTILKNPLIVTYSHTIKQVPEVKNLMEYAITSKRPIVFFCEDIDGEAAAYTAVNNMQGRVDCAVVKNPYGSTLRGEFLEDISIVVGSTIISNENNINIEDTEAYMLGSAEEIRITRQETTIVCGSGDEESVKARIKELEARAPEEQGQAKVNVEKRIGKLKGLAAVIKMGANSDVEAEEKLDRVEDAIWAVRSAIEEGVVPGGGTALVEARKVLDGITPCNDDEAVGIKIVFDSVIEPLKQIAINAGSNGGTEVEKVIASESGFGWNALNGGIENFYESGIIDPAKVTRCALQNGASVAGMLITTQCIIVNE